MIWFDILFDVRTNKLSPLGKLNTWKWNYHTQHVWHLSCVPPHLASDRECYSLRFAFQGLSHLAVPNCPDWILQSGSSFQSCFPSLPSSNTFQHCFLAFFPQPHVVASRSWCRGSPMASHICRSQSSLGRWVLLYSRHVKAMLKSLECLLTAFYSRMFWRVRLGSKCGAKAVLTETHRPVTSTRVRLTDQQTSLVVKSDLRVWLGMSR